MTIRGIEHVALAYPVGRPDEARSCYTGLIIDELRALARMLKDKGCRAGQAMLPGGRERMFAPDPFGSKLEAVACPS